MKLSILILFVALYLPVKSTKYQVDNFKFNTCDFKNHKQDISKLTGVSIIKYLIVKNENKEKRQIAAYYLIKHLTDTFNVIHIFNCKSSDSIIKENRWSSNWNFEKMKDTCIGFYSNINLQKTINHRYPVIIGAIYAEID